VVFLKESGISHEFFTIVLPGIHSASAIEELKSLLKGSKYTLQKIKVHNNEEVAL